MAVEYTMAAHPTTYGGARFRSRLEATWAAFFDLLEWKWEYEPIDLNGWVPDFLIHGRHRDALVEVKPIVGIDGDVVEKMRLANDDSNYLFLCGISPVVDSLGVDILRSLHSCCCCETPKCNFMNRFIVQIEGKYDVVFEHGPYVGFVTGLNVGNRRGAQIDEYMGREVEVLWRQAKNTTQWRPR